MEGNKTYLGVKSSEFSFYPEGAPGKLLFASGLQHPAIRIADSTR